MNENIKHILTILKHNIISERKDFEVIDFVITIDVFGSYVRLKKFKDDDFVYIDGFIYLEKPIPQPSMVIIHPLIDNHIRVGINVDKKSRDLNDELIHNILMHDRIYKDDITIDRLDHAITIIYNCMTKVTGMVIGLGNSIVVKKELNGDNNIINDKDTCDEMKSYG